VTRILYGDQAHAALLRGAERMARLLRPTLGPVARTVAIDRLVGTRPPEILDSGATIARRTLQIQDPFEDMGAMIVRHVAWRVFDQVGDGSATAAVLCHAALREAGRMIAAGAQPVAVRRGLEHALDIAIGELKLQASPIDSSAAIAHAIGGTIRNDKLAALIGEVVDSVGPDGAILVEGAEGTATTAEYVDGVRWNEGFHSSFLLPERDATSGRLLEPRVLVTDHTIDRAEQLVPALEACVATGHKSLFIVAPEVRDAAIGLLVVNREKGVLEGALAVKAPSFGAQRAGILRDLAAITGGRFISQERADRLEDIALHDLGLARQAWASRLAFGIIGGRGERGAIRQRISEAKAELSAGVDDDYTRDKIKERIGKLGGTAVILHVGAASISEQEDLKMRIEAAVRSARSAVEGGVVPGGGAALLACVPALAELSAAAHGDEVAGVTTLMCALAEPARWIMRNAGLAPEPILHHARGKRGYAYDVVREAWSEDLVDPLAVVQAALETGISAAAAALTADVLVRRNDPSVAVNP
jgi:chaperonin GroEL